MTLFSTSIAICFTAVVVWVLTYIVSRRDGLAKGHDEALLDLYNMSENKRHEKDGKLSKKLSGVQRVRDRLNSVRKPSDSGK